MKIFSLFLLFASQVLLAANPVNQVPTSANEFQWNRWMGPVPFSTHMGTKLRDAHNTAVGAWDYSKTGGAEGDHEVGITLPDNAIVRKAFFDVVTTPDAGGAGTIAFKVQSAGDLKTATATSSWADQVDGALDGAVANFIKLSAERKVYATLVSTYSAGKIKVYVDYVLSE